MSWHDGEPVPERPSPVQVPFAMRGRRLQVFIGAVGAVVLAAGGLAVARMGGDDSTDVRADGGRTTTASVSDTASLTPAPSALEPPTSVPPVVPPMTDGPGSRVPGADAGTGPGGTPSPGVPPDGATPPTSAVVRADTCSPSEILVTATPDRPSYPRGVDVIVTATARNQSTRPCDPRDPSVEIRDRAGALAVGMGAADKFTFPPVSWPPGGELKAPFTWNRTVCDDTGCRRAEPGTYTAIAVFGEYRSSPVTFTIL